MGFLYVCCDPISRAIQARCFMILFSLLLLSYLLLVQRMF